MLKRTIHNGIPRNGTGCIEEACTELPDYRNPSLSAERRAVDLLGRMTLDEKVAQLGSVLWDVVLWDENGKFSGEKAAQILKNGVLHVGRPGMKRSPRKGAEFTNGIQKFLKEKTRLGIPALFHEEALHGFMALGATSFPQAIALGGTWDADLVERVYAAAAREMRARGSNYALTPDLDLGRDPRWGRIEETFGEDPFLVARMGVAAVRGLQGPGPDIAADRVAATAKHFAAHGQPEGGTNAAPVNVSGRELREAFFVPFRAAVETGVHSVMASYNEIDGIPSHVNRWLLTDVLRGEWGFPGFVTSDGWGIPQLVTIHRVASDTEEASRKSLEAGVDTQIETSDCYGTLVNQVREGRVDEALVDRSVLRVLRVKFLMGLFENPYADPDLAEGITNCPAHRALALEAARKAVVLLKNEKSALPLDRSQIKTIAVIGPNAADLHLGGYSWDPGRGVTVLEGIRTAAGKGITVLHAEGCRINEGLHDWRAWHEDAVKPSDPKEDDSRIAEAVQIANQVDIAICVVGGNEATCREAWADNHPGDVDDLNLIGRQDDLVRAVAGTGTPTVVVLINGRPQSINWIAGNVPAILECWYPGQEGGAAVAEALFGDVNPGGKLTVTFPRNVGQLPVYYNHKPSAKRGYLFSDKSPLFPFGHGLSYTSFSYENLTVSPPRIPPGGTATVHVELTNTGKRKGDEIVQLYIRDRVSSLTRPVKELKGFERISLSPGRTKTVEFKITPDLLAFYNMHMERIVEPGVFDILVGRSSADVLTAELEVVADARGLPTTMQ